MWAVFHSVFFNWIKWDPQEMKSNSVKWVEFKQVQAKTVDMVVSGK
jgi:hypothetical protein